MMFFDSHGGLWATTDLDTPAEIAARAVAFGPTGAAVECDRPAITLAALGVILRQEEHETPYTAARRAGRTRDEDGWSSLT